MAPLSSKVVVCGRCLVTLPLTVNETLTPSLPQPGTLPGCKMHGRACEKSISGPIALLLSMLGKFMKILSHASAKKKTKRLRGFKFHTLKWSFSSDLAAVKRLKWLSSLHMLKQE